MTFQSRKRALRDVPDRKKKMSKSRLCPILTAEYFPRDLAYEEDGAPAFSFMSVTSVMVVLSLSCRLLRLTRSTLIGYHSISMCASANLGACSHAGCARTNCACSSDSKMHLTRCSAPPLLCTPVHRTCFVASWLARVPSVAALSCTTSLERSGALEQSRTIIG